ncbi:uncharacterized protein LOC112490254 [Ziziphus jujuba]|uniref:Uncharacterized protein LOC112490254 n=1 Tax=Ziziphus jujuba TaxID=326968 RepID=A0A6P6FVE7_ZIZJJ|nr:uncharacterized protein LOC112490254 [Ziziphus jujuba]
MLKKIAFAVLVMCLMFCRIESVAAASVAEASCYDQCSTGCVQSNTRKMQRCDRKCQIKCGPDSEVDKHYNEFIKV